MKKIMPIMLIGILILSGIGTLALTEGKSFQINNTLKNNKIFIDGPQVEWNKTFGGVGNDFATGVLQTMDGGYVFVGQRDGSGHHEDGDCWLIKIDNNGEMIWEKTYGGDGNEIGYKVDQTSDGGYIIFGITSSYGVGDDDGWVIKTDSYGNEIWNITFGGLNMDNVLSGDEISDGGYILAGGTQSFGAGDSAGWLIKTDNNGEEIWNKVYDEDNPISEYFMSVYETDDGGYITTGRQYLYENDWILSDIWLMKIDGNGNKEWSTLLGGQYGDAGRSVSQTSDRGYIITGQSGRSEGNEDWDAILIKTDIYGNEEWVTLWGDNNHYETGYSVVQTTDDGYIITGRKILKNTNLGDLFLIKNDHYGNILWSKTYGSEVSDDRGYDICQTSDGGCIIVGYTNQYGSGGLDGWVIKLSSIDNQRPNKPNRPTGSTSGKINNEYIYKTSTSDLDSDDLYYFFDWDDGTTSEWFGPFKSGDEIEATKSWIMPGSYEIRVKAKDIYGGESDWSDPLSVSMPRSKSIIKTIFYKFFDQHLFLGRLLEMIVKTY